MVRLVYRNTCITKQWQKREANGKGLIGKLAEIKQTGWVRMWENICFNINGNVLYRISESKKDFEFIEDKSWQDIMMKCFHFTAKNIYRYILWVPAFLCFFPQSNLWYCYWNFAVNFYNKFHSPLHSKYTAIIYLHLSIYQPFYFHYFYNLYYTVFWNEHRRRRE